MAQKGEKHHNAKLTNKMVKEIRELYFQENNSLNQTQLAKIYGVGQRHISRITSGKGWPHVL